jgi:hypothetical protein
VENPDAVEMLTKWLRTDKPGKHAGVAGRCEWCGSPTMGPLRCKAPLRLRDAQARTILECTDLGGGLAQLGVGAGKTLTATLLPTAFAREHGVKRAAILVPSKLVDSFKRAIVQARDHGWIVLPNLERYVIGYGRLSIAGSEDLLTGLDIQMVVCDEAHSLRERKSARTRRFLRLFSAQPHTKFTGLSGTFLHRSPLDYAHLAKLALGDERSPLPRHYPELADWSKVVCAPKADEEPLPPGAILGLGLPHHNAYEAFAHRVLGTPGIVSTKQASVDASIRATVLKPRLPRVLQEAVESVLNAWEIPGGHVIADSNGMHRAVSQLSLGFYSRLVFPIDADVTGWYDARRNWARFCRSAYAKHSLKLDSELPVAQAVLRGELKDLENTYQTWREFKERVVPRDEVVWLDREYLPTLADKWLKSGGGKGLIWTHWVPAGELLGQAGHRYYPGGTDPEKDAPFNSAVLSVAAHHEGRNLQFANRNLCLTMTPSGKVWQQLIGRTHRQGQDADEVSIDFYCPTSLACDKLQAARLHADWLGIQQGETQRMSLADWSEE